MRKLASIQKITSVTPIEGADNIEQIQILGWQLVSKRGEFTPGDLAVYIEIDSLLPYNNTFAFLWPPSSGEDRQPLRLRSKKIKGVLSQGLALPVGILPEDSLKQEGADVTEVLQITKWEPPNTSSSREIECAFPSNLFPKTDEVRVQSVPDVLDELRGTECYAAIKVDGQSLTFAKYEFDGQPINRVCSRNFCLKNIPGSPHWQAAQQLNIFEKLPLNYAIQGEFAGEGIQGNRLGLRGRKFFAFQVFDIANKKYLDFKDFIEFCSSRGITTVPIEWVRKLDLTLDSALLEAQGLYENGFPREGLVIRPTSETVSHAISRSCGIPNSRASFKVINNKFLLKTGE